MYRCIRGISVREQTRSRIVPRYVDKLCFVFFLTIMYLEKLKNSKYGTSDAVDHITKRFDETTKRLFRDQRDPQFILFGSPLDKDLSVGIRNGQLRLSG